MGQMIGQYYLVLIGPSCMVPTGVNPAGDAGDTSPIFWLGYVNGSIPQYYYILSDIAKKYYSSSPNDSI